VRSEITISRTLDEEEVKKCALADAKILPWIGGKEIRRVIYVAGRLVNIVI
jgi:leucyl-tRNA synthetase